MLTEQVNEEAIKRWLAECGIEQYEIFPDGSISIYETVNTISQNDLMEFGESGLLAPPFTRIREIRGDAEISFQNGVTKRIDQFINAIHGRARFYVTEDCPVLSFPRIKGITDLSIEIMDDDSGEFVTTINLEQMLNAVRAGEMDIFDVQEQLIDAGFGKMARQ